MHTASNDRSLVSVSEKVLELPQNSESVEPASAIPDGAISGCAHEVDAHEVDAIEGCANEGCANEGCANEETVPFPSCESSPQELYVLVSDSRPEIPLNIWMQADPNHQALDRITWWILTCMTVFISLIGWGISWLVRDSIDITQWSLLGAIGLIAYLGYLASGYFPRKSYETSWWQLRPNGIEIRRGIWWQHRLFVPHDRIQHTDVSQGPIARRFGVSHLTIHTGGTHDSQLTVGGLNAQVAEQLRDKLSKSRTSISSQNLDSK
jgi:uncharacterized protein